MTIDWNKLSYDPFAADRHVAPSRQFMLRIGEPRSAVPIGSELVLRSGLQVAGTFRPSRLLLSIVGGEIVDLGRFYALRVNGRRYQRRRPNYRRRAWLAASEAIRIARDPSKVDPILYVTDVWIGAEKQTAGDPIPAQIFAPDMMDVGIEGTPMTAGMEYRVTIANPDGRRAWATAALSGMLYSS